MKRFNNKQFLKKFNAGDKQAFLAVYDAFIPKIFRFVYYKVRSDKVIAEDIAQLTFTKTWEYIISGKREIENIQAFLYQSARNLIIDRWRGAQRESLPLMDELIETTEKQPRWIEKIDAKISVELLERTLDSIPDQYREVIIMRYLEELDIDEIAQVLGKDKNNVYVLIHRAMKALRKQLETEELIN